MEIVFHRTFQKKFKKLPSNVKKQFEERLGMFSKNPEDPILRNHSVDKTFVGCRSINITGDYRAIFYFKDNTAIFIAVGSHSELYS